MHINIQVGGHDRANTPTFMSSSQDEYSSAGPQSGIMSGDNMRRLHGHIIRFSLIDSVLVLLLLMTGFNGSGSTITLFALLAVLLIVPLSVVSIVMMHRKSSGGLNVGIVNLSLTGSLLLLIGLFGIHSQITGVGGSLLLSVALTLLGVSSLRRVKTMRNVAYSTWYHSHSSQEVAGNESEVLSTCPSCDSILAVIPSKLTTEDRCPNCGSMLVSTD